MIPMIANCVTVEQRFLLVVVVWTELVCFARVSWVTNASKFSIFNRRTHALNSHSTSLQEAILQIQLSQSQVLQITVKAVEETPRQSHKSWRQVHPFAQGWARSDDAYTHLQALLDFNQDLNVALLDQVVSTLFSGGGPQVNTCRRRGQRTAGA